MIKSRAFSQKCSFSVKLLRTTQRQFFFKLDTLYRILQNFFEIFHLVVFDQKNKEKSLFVNFSKFRVLSPLINLSIFTSTD